RWPPEENAPRGRQAGKYGKDFGSRTKRGKTESKRQCVRAVDATYLMHRCAHLRSSITSPSITFPLLRSIARSSREAKSSPVKYPIEIALNFGLSKGNASIAALILTGNGIRVSR